MDVQSICKEIIARSLQGLMFHDRLISYFEFLNLDGYAMCHKYHYLEESLRYRDFYDFCISFYCKLIPDSDIRPDDVIPASWYNNLQWDVDNDLKKNSINNGFKVWWNWENGTLDFYQQKYKELINLGEIALAERVEVLIADVAQERIEIQKQHLQLRAIDYDLSQVVDMQDKIEKDYKKKRKKLL